MIAKEVVQVFRRDERSAIVEEVVKKVKEYFDEKFEKLFKIVDKSKGRDDGDADFEFMNYRQYDILNDSFEPQFDINAGHDGLHKVADENVRGEEAGLEGHVQVFEQVQCVEQ
nr:uncharacterized protein LOC104118488 [Nicotiana tomentosiformis]